MPLKKIIWLILFAIAMGMLESAVVIYLRELYYKDGFGFPLKTIPVSIARVETWREVATIVMLAGVGILTGINRLQRFAFFVLAFAVWDLFYYIFLYLFLGWPESLRTWDILFLIPAPWVGPVWAPCLLCLLMIIGSIYIIGKTEKENNFIISRFYWGLMISGSLICIFSFMWDYIFWSGNSSWSFFSEQALFEDIKTYVPQHFNTGLFLTGFLMMLTSVILYIRKNKKVSSV
jgi:hypothetical protein